MTTAELKEYLGMVVDVEKELYTQRTLEKTMQNKIEILGNRKKSHSKTTVECMESQNVTSLPGRASL